MLTLDYAENHWCIRSRLEALLRRCLFYFCTLILSFLLDTTTEAYLAQIGFPDFYPLELDIAIFLLLSSARQAQFTFATIAVYHRV